VRTLLGKLLVAAVVALGFGGATDLAKAGWAESPPIRIFIDEDAFWNYDFKSVSTYQGNVDWPVTLMFWNNASINRVKSLLNSPYDQASPGEQRAALIDFGYPWIWDGDGGRKTTLCPGAPLQPRTARHYRIYADAPPGQTGGVAGGDDRIYNLSWGFWVFGTTHFDVDECRGPGSSPWFGLSENVEDWIVSDWSAKGYAVSPDWDYFHNYEPFELQGDHYYDNNGYASAFYVG
jgi:hypothetical protein